MCQIDLAVPYEGWKDLDPPLDEDSVRKQNTFDYLKFSNPLSLPVSIKGSVRGRLFLSPLRPHIWETNGVHPGVQEPQEDGLWRVIRPLR